MRVVKQGKTPRWSLQLKCIGDFIQMNNGCGATLEIHRQDIRKRDFKIRVGERVYRLQRRIENIYEYYTAWTIQCPNCGAITKILPRRIPNRNMIPYAEN